MFRGVLLVCLSLVLSSYEGYHKCEQCSRSDLKGKVKRFMEVKTWDHSNGDTIRSGADTIVETYNLDGLITFRGTYEYNVYKNPSCDSVIHESGYEHHYYYNKGKLLERSEYFDRVLLNPLVQTTYYTYDRQGRRVSSEHEESKGDDWFDGTVHTEYKYDDNGRLILGTEKRTFTERSRTPEVSLKILSYPSPTEQREYWRTHGNTDTSLIAYIQYNERGDRVQDSSYFGVTKYVVDNEGRIKEARYHTREGIYSATTRYTYSGMDKYGNYTLLTSEHEQIDPQAGTINKSTQPVIQRFIEYYE